MLNHTQTRDSRGHTPRAPTTSINIGSHQSRTAQTSLNLQETQDDEDITLKRLVQDIVLYYTRTKKKKYIDNLRMFVPAKSMWYVM